MNKCQHNQLIDLFCVSQHCEWKQAGGCHLCIKKYHNHIGNTKFLTEQELQNILKKFNIDHSYKPNCRNIQQSIYSYFGTLKTQIINSIQLICKTFITQLGSPYLFQNNLFTVHKRIKNKQYKRLNQKDFRKLYQASKKVNLSQLSKQQGKLYKQQLKKDQKFITSLQNLLVTYQSLFKQLLENYKHEKTHFDTLNSFIKQSLQSELPSNLSQFHQKSMQKNRIQRAEKIQKALKNQSKILKNQSEIPFTNLNNGRVKSLSKDREYMSTTLKKQQTFLFESNNHKLGIKDLTTIQKSQKRQDTKAKRPISLDKKLNLSSTQQYNQKKRSDLSVFEEFKNQGEKCKIYMGQKDKKSDLLSDFFSQNSTKRSETNNSSYQEKKQLTAKENQINVRKEKLIQMMKNHSGVYKNHEKDKNLNPHEKLHQNQYNVSINNQNYTNQIQAKYRNQNGISDSAHSSTTTESPVRKNLSIIIQPKKYLNPIEEKKHCSLLNEAKKSIQVNQHKAQSKLSPPPLPKWQIKSIQNIDQKDSDSSAEGLKKILQKNMLAHSKLPFEQNQRKQKQIGCSRLIIVPTKEKFLINQLDQCDSPLVKKKVNHTKNMSTQLKNELKTQKTQESSPAKYKKNDLKENQQKSLNLLIKSIHLPHDEAIGLLQAALKQAPNNLSAAEYLSFLHLQSNKPKQALNVCNTILDRFQIITKENQELLLNLQNNKSAALNILGRYSQAIVLLEKCLKIKQKDVLLKNLGDAYYFNSNYEKAIFYYEKSLKLNSNYDEACYNMAACLYLQNNFHNAKMSILRALQTAPKNPDYLQLKKQIDEKINHSASLNHQ